MKFLATLAVVLGATLAFSDITIKPDGSVSCTGGCTGTVNPNGTITFCQGSVCLVVDGKNYKLIQPGKPTPETSDK